MIQILRDFFRPVENDNSPVFSDFRRALAREILITERLRVWAVIVTVAGLLAVVTVAHMLSPTLFERMSHGRFDLTALYVISVPFLIFEWSVTHLLSRRIALNRDVPVLRRYLSALIETSLPTLALYLHMNWMGPELALAFAAPLTYSIFIILSTLRLDFWLSTFTGLVAAAGMLGMAMLYHPVAFAHEAPAEFAFQTARCLFLLLGGILAGAVGLLLRRQFEASIAAVGARDNITNLFGQHVSPQVVEQLLASGKGVATEIRQVAVMFVDIRAFTAAARLRTPHEVLARLDAVFAVMVDVLDRHSGIVNKFLGDGFLALFGAPIGDPLAAQHAVAAGREMLVAMEQNNIDSDWPMRIGIGIHLGTVVAGTVGSPRRKEYTVIGDTVNFAARLESLNKDYGSQLLVSTSVRDALSESSGESFGAAVLLGEVPIRGYDAPQAIWRLA